MARGVPQVDLSVLPDVLLLAFGQFAANLARDPRDERTGRHDRARQDHRAGRDQRPRANDRSIENRRIHPDQAIVLDGSPMQHGAVAGSDIAPDRQREALVDVTGRAVLQIRVFTDGDRCLFGPQYGVVPNARARRQADISDYDRTGRDECRLGQIRGSNARHGNDQGAGMHRHGREHRRPARPAHNMSRMNPLPALGGSDYLGGSDCEAIRNGWVAQPVNMVTSSAYVAAAGWAAARIRRLPPDHQAAARAYAALLALVGIGSIDYHGPQSPVAELAHDFPIALLSAGIGVAAVHRRRQGRPVLAGADRRTRVGLIGLMAGAGLSYSLGRTGSPCCDPTSWRQPHGLWHVLSASWFALLFTGLFDTAPALHPPQDRK